MKGLWIVDSPVHTLEVFEWTNGRWEAAGTFADDAAVRAVPFHAIELELGALWAYVEQSAQTE